MRLNYLQPILLKVNKMETEGARTDVANFIEKLELCVSGDMIFFDFL